MLTLCLASAPARAQKRKKKGKVTLAPPPAAVKKDEGPKPYLEIITAKAVTDRGLFDVHRVDEKYYYEIPDSLFEREMLLVSRIAKTADKIGYGGEEVGTEVLRWQKKGNRVLLRVVSYANVAGRDSAIYESVRSSNFEPLLAAFDIKARRPDSSGAVIEITELFNKDVPMLGLDKTRREQFKVRRLDDKRSFIEGIRSFPLNIEARSVLTYDAAEPPSNSTTGTISLEMNHSMVLLPREPMKPRLFDQRVGWFGIQQKDYGLNEQRAADRRYIVRWRLEPKDPDAFRRGELVEPKKPIVYYIDPATPLQWRPYLKQGVNDWNQAFEAAGFKNAIVAKDPPTAQEDPEFSPEDVRYSVIRYFSSDIQNAYGPNVHDPRSGEILESDIGWYHNVMNLLRNWYFVQTAAINPDARRIRFDDKVMGQLIRFVSSHEVGHTLGLPHNMGASSAYPVDSLRSASFTQRMGTAPSIMDYARFNYVAQPEDQGVALMPNIGVYDKYAIEWGYRPILEAKTPDEEKKTLDAMITRHAGDKAYRFGRQTFNPVDPSSQTEDLGDDAVKASTYGIANLKRILPNLLTWTSESGKDYKNLEELYGQVLGQWRRYLGHVTANVGGVYENYKTYDQPGAVYEPVAKARQKAALRFLNEQAFRTPTWMIDETILRRVEAAGNVERLRDAQVTALNNVLDPGRLARLVESEALLGGQAYGLLEMMTDLRGGLWSELKTGGSIDTYRRSLQRGYIERLEYLMKNEPPLPPVQVRELAGFTAVRMSQSDIRPVARGELKTLRGELRAALPKARDTASRYHIEDAIARIDLILNPNG
ncbi:MAG: zinc-dependent metalloprotease [Ferruginibacter sp.]|nr:zinc-dependent metalloprotease [Cytophagales bacterium]